MSKEEKKDRVIFLFEQELSEAREEEQAMDDLMSQLERLEGLRPGTAKRLKEAVRSIGLVEEVAGRTRWLRLRNSGWLGWLLAGAGACFLLLVAAFVVYRSWSGAPTNPVSGGAVPLAESPAGDPEIQFRGDVSEATHLSGTESLASVVTTTTAAATTSVVNAVVNAAPATLNTTSLDMVHRLRRLGHESLKRSDCYQAAHYFNLSREQLHKKEANVTEVLGLQFSLSQDHAFALICSRRFQEGIALLEGCLTSTLKCDSKLLNALGYAFFQLEDFETAARVFQMGLSEDPENPIIWNNLGAARMDLGDLEAADFALDKAAAIAEKIQENHPRQLTIANVQELTHRVKIGTVKNRAQVDIWFKKIFPEKEMRSKEL